MGQRQKKKNLLRSKEKLNRRIQELENTIWYKDCEIKDRKYDVDRLLTEIHKLQMRLAVFGTMPVYKELNPAGIGGYQTVETQTLAMETIPWGSYRVVKENELEKVLNDKKKEIVKGLAEAILNNGLAQIIIHTSKDYEGPFGGKQLMDEGKATIGVKLYVIPWEETKVYRESVVRMTVLAEENDTNYATLYMGITDEQRQHWLEGN